MIMTPADAGWLFIAGSAVCGTGIGLLAARSGHPIYRRKTERNKSVNETQDTCTVYVTRHDAHCGMPATRVITTACDYGHNETHGVCPTHAESLMAGRLLCTICRRFHDRKATTYPQFLYAGHQLPDLRVEPADYRGSL